MTFSDVSGYILNHIQALRAYRSLAQLSKRVRPWFVVYQASRKYLVWPLDSYKSVIPMYLFIMRPLAYKVKNKIPRVNFLDDPLLTIRL